MSTSIMKSSGGWARRALAGFGALTALAVGSAYASVPGIGILTGASQTFNLQANQGYSTQPDGVQLYSWGYGCNTGYSPTYQPAVFNAPGVAFCPAMQLPGPTLIVTEGQIVTVTLTNNLPAAAGSTSIVFTGFTPAVTTANPGTIASSGGTAGVMAMEAAHGVTVTYTLNTAGKAGTHAYYSGTQPDLQIEMGLYGALVVLPKTPGVVPTAAAGTVGPCEALGSHIGGGIEYRLAPAAYDHPATCYDREYLTQWGEIDPIIHAQVEAQSKAAANASCVNPHGCLAVVTEPYHPRYFVINGRSMPDDMDPDYAPNYPAQPYNGNPHMHPLDQVLLRVIGQGRWQHPFHEHANHVRILGRDGNLILSQTDATKLAGLMMFNTDTSPGQAFDGIFYWSGRGLSWDIYGHTTRTVNGVAVPACTAASNAIGGANPTVPASCVPECLPDANGYFTSASGAVAPIFAAAAPFPITNLSTASLNYGEWCADHNHPLEANPAALTGAGGPATLPDPQVETNGLWFNGTPYLGPDAVTRSRGPTPLPPGGALQNPPGESGIAFMWHSHNEREITTNDVFPGGMLMMMLVDPPVWYIDETL